jgi:hypothetical protein
VDCGYCDKRFILDGTEAAKAGTCRTAAARPPDQRLRFDQQQPEQRAGDRAHGHPDEGHAHGVGAFELRNPVKIARHGGDHHHRDHARVSRPDCATV